MTPEERAEKICEHFWPGVLDVNIRHADKKWLTKEIREAVAEERERCARIAEKNQDQEHAYCNIAAEIRQPEKRGEE